MRSFVASYTELVLCFGAAGSDFGLTLQLYVSSSGQILKWLHVCERERWSFGCIVLFCVKQGFWTMFFSHVCCCDVQKNALKCKTQNPTWCTFSPMARF